MSHYLTTDLQAFVLPNVRATGKVIGIGAYGSVEAVEIPGALCAAKKIHAALQDRSAISAAEMRSRMASKFAEECHLMSRLRHPHIVQFLGVCSLPDARLPALVMELLLTSLHDLLDPDTGPQPQTPPYFPLCLKCSILHDVARGLEFLHERSPPIIHRDLSAKNVLLNSAMVAKIADMGVARIVPRLQAAAMTKAPGAAVYMPPEALEDNPRYDVTIDIFSFGVVAIFTLSQTFPCDLLAPTFTDDKTRELRPRSELERREKCMNKVYRQLHKSHSLIQMIGLCLKNNPEERPNIREVEQLLNKARADTQDEVCDMNKLELVQMVRKKDEEIQSLRRRSVKAHDKSQSDDTPPPLPPKPGPQRTTEELVMMQNLKPGYFAKAKCGHIRGRSARQAWKGAANTDDYNYMNYITEEDFSSPLVVARYSYQANSSDELCFKKGETLVVTCYNLEFKKERGERWYVVSNNGNGKLLLSTSKEERDGWMLAVPTKPGREKDGEKLVYHRYVGSVGTLAAHSWYLPGTLRAQVEGYLSNPGLPCGCYFVRRSNKDAGKVSNIYTLSYIDKSEKVCHCRMVQDPVILEWTIGDFKSREKNLQDILTTLVENPEVMSSVHITVPCPFIPSDHNSPSSTSMECDRGAITFNERVKQEQLSEVWKGVFCGCKEVAIRIFNGGVMDRTKFQAVADSLWSFRHSSLLQLMAICSLTEPYCCVTELITDTISLNTYISVYYEQMSYQQVMTHFDEDIMNILLNVLDGMCALEQKLITHGNLGSWNILIGENKTVKLTDYGLLSSFTPQAHHTIITTYCQWAAPEVLRDSSTSLKSDVWSFGVLLYDMATPERQGTGDPPHGPYGSMMDRDALLRKLDAGLRLPRPDSCPRKLYQLMQACWREEPAKRPTFLELRSAIAQTAV